MDTGAWWEGRERVINARPIPPTPAQRRLQPPRPVRARIEWSKSGVESIETEATAWVPGLVLVPLLDARSLVRGAWLTTTDAVPLSPKPDIGSHVATT